MLTEHYIHALSGGVMIGLSAAGLLWLNGRIAGISGILSGALENTNGSVTWRWAFLLGLPAGALMFSLVGDVAYFHTDPPSLLLMIAAGLLVGVGTRIGGGCTSGHGVCGLGRLSARSLAATVTFMLTAVITVFITRHVIGAG